MLSISIKKANEIKKDIRNYHSQIVAKIEDISVLRTSESEKIIRLFNEANSFLARIYGMSDIVRVLDVAGISFDEVYDAVYKFMNQKIYDSNMAQLIKENHLEFTFLGQLYFR